MKVIFVKNGKMEPQKIKAHNFDKIKEAVVSIATGQSGYKVILTAENPKEIDLVAVEHFHNIPLPAESAKTANWFGDMALFLILNMPDALINELQK